MQCPRQARHGERAPWISPRSTPPGPPRILSLAKSTRNDRQLLSARRSVCCRPSVKIIKTSGSRLPDQTRLMGMSLISTFPKPGRENDAGLNGCHDTIPDRGFNGLRSRNRDNRHVRLCRHIGKVLKNLPFINSAASRVDGINLSGEPTQTEIGKRPPADFLGIRRCPDHGYRTRDMQGRFPVDCLWCWQDHAALSLWGAVPRSRQAAIAFAKSPDCKPRRWHCK